MVNKARRIALPAQPKPRKPAPERRQRPQGLSRNASNRAALKGGASLEPSSTGQRPSRKSTRGSTGRIKSASNLQRRQIRKARSPSTRAAKAQAASVGRSH